MLRRRLQRRVVAALTCFALLSGSLPLSAAAAQESVVESQSSNPDVRTLKALEGIPGLLESSEKIPLIPDVPVELRTSQPGKDPDHLGADIATTVTAGSTLAEGVQLKAADGSFISLSSNGLRDSGAAAAGPGLTTYSSPSSNTDAAVQAVEDGSVRMLTVLHGPDAPRDIAYDLKLSSGLRLEADEAGGFRIVNPEGFVVGAVSAPWAISADGAKVPTHYTLQGNRLIQTVDHAGATYPVVADPKVSLGKGVYIRYNRGETHRIGFSGWQELENNLDALVCLLLLNPAAAGVCAAAIVTLQRQIQEKAKQAYEEGKCLMVVVSYAGVPYRWEPYSGRKCK